MTTNTYQSLCDDTVAYEECDKCFIECGQSAYDEPCPEISCKHYDNKFPRHYPPATAEQRERLEELILKLGRLSYHKSDIYYICILSRVNNANNGMTGTRAEALYTLTHKLFKEGILGKEEVKEALCTH